jgi:pimeloyl-ACP methyl ester carboxylesterase
MTKKFLLRSMGLSLNIQALVAPKAAARRAYALFATPPAPHLRPKEIAFLKTARIAEYEMGQQTVVTYHWGEEGQPLILLSYGWAYNAGRWRHYVPALVEAGFHVVAYDPPGHGWNNKGKRFLNVAINAAIQRHLLEQYGPVEAVLAHSFGGSSAVYTIAQMPAHLRPKRMVLMASFSSAPQVFQGFKKALGLWPNVFYGMIRYAEAQVGAPIHTFDMARMSGQLEGVDALLVHDPKDAVTSFTHIERYHAFWPNSALLRAKGAGHHLGTAEVTNAVLQFLIKGETPPNATYKAEKLPADHDLVRYFAGMEVQG